MTSDAGFLVPKESCVGQKCPGISIVPEIPRTLTGKLFRRALLGKSEFKWPKVQWQLEGRGCLKLAKLISESGKEKVKTNGK